MNNDNRQKRLFILLVVSLICIELTYIYFNYYIATKITETKEEEDISEREEGRVKRQEEDISDDIEDSPYEIERIKLDNDFSMIYINGEAYLLYDNGYGAGRSTALTKMDNSKGDEYESQ